MLPTGRRFITENIEAYAAQCDGDRIRELALDPLNLDIIDRHQKAFDAANEAQAAGQCDSEFEAALPMYELFRLVPTDPMLDRDFLTGRNT